MRLPSAWPLELDVFESSCLGLQLKAGGKFHLKLNIGGRPIAYKYREGKMQQNFEKRVKEYLKLLKRKRRKPVLLVGCISWVTCDLGAATSHGLSLLALTEERLWS